MPLHKYNIPILSLKPLPTAIIFLESYYLPGQLIYSQGNPTLLTGRAVNKYIRNVTPFNKLPYRVDSLLFSVDTSSSAQPYIGKPS